MPKFQAPDHRAAPGRGRPSRRAVLAGAAAAAAAAGGVPLLSGCSAGESSGRDGTTGGKDLKKLLPTYVASRVSDPDIPGRNGSSPGFTRAPAPEDLTRSVRSAPGGGGTYTAFTPLWGTPPPKDALYYRAVNKELGATVRWQTQDGNYYGEKLSAVLASDDIADIVCVPQWEMQGRVHGAISAKFADLGPYLSGDRVKKYPNLAAIPTDAWRMSVFGGRLRGLPMPARPLGGVIPFYRQDLFEKEGYEVPRSPAEFLALAKEITRPKSRVWACEDMWWSAQIIFGCPPEKPYYWTEENGKLVHKVETDAYLEALEWTRKLYAAKVVHPDAVAGKANDMTVRFTSGQSLMMNDGDGKWYGLTFEQATANPGFRIQAMDFFGADGGDPVLYQGAPANIWSFLNKNLSKEQIEECLALADFIAAPYGTREQRLIEYGIEGEHHTIEDGVPVKTEKGVKEVLDTYRFVVSPQASVAYPDHPRMVKDYCGWMQRMGRHMRKPLFHGMQIQEPNRYASLYTPFEDLNKDVVRGRKPMRDAQRAVEDWRRGGGDKLRDWYAELLEKNGSGV
ncbi:extracellular solute-binding protein [Streptomyces zingiberis]|uniref:Extracellular solute-binding protein n=1 Tax=Streptomyces zingiberis TaxID=2053010 RepID=A0ABX1C2W5_9ACTN|nr:extracellular solute-binding protein [Streptomyces zingiberis]NJQ02257.1 extracellular solute-binding protein [Streptomyces zingiberis]